MFGLDLAPTPELSAQRIHACSLVSIYAVTTQQMFGDRHEGWKPLVLFSLSSEKLLQLQPDQRIRGCAAKINFRKCQNMSSSLQAASNRSPN